MKAIILTRVSTNNQQDGHSIDAQKVRLKQFCNKKSIFSERKNLRKTQDLNIFSEWEKNSIQTTILFHFDLILDCIDGPQE